MDAVFPIDIENMQHDNFRVAFGITSYDGDPERVEDPRYGKIKARYDTWGLGERYKDLDAHYCTDEELGLADGQDNPLFWPIYKNAMKDLLLYKKKLYCIDEDLKI